MTPDRHTPVGAWIGPLIFPGLLVWFAGQALTGMLLASYRHDSLRRVPKGDLESVSQDAYDIADAMLEARSK